MERMYLKFSFSAMFWLLTGFAMSFAQNCGQPPLSGNRIVGGIDAKYGAWPWQVDIQTLSERHICGGSIITENWVLSAAHCFTDPSNVGIYTIYAGRSQLNGFNAHESSHKVSRIVIPAGYSEPHGGKDMALVQLSSPIPWSDYVHPVCLPTSGVQFPNNMMCYVTGWGNIRDNVPLPGVATLQQVQVPIISQSSCQEMYNQNPTEKIDILSDMICAGYQEGGKDSCQGDSGGPLVCRMENGTWVQAGVVSFGLGCAHANQPGVYARLTSYPSFITDTIPDIALYGRANHNWCGITVVLFSCLTTLLTMLYR